MKLNSRGKHIGKIVVGRNPTKRTLTLQGKTVYDKYTNRFMQSVWRKITFKDKGIKRSIYSLYRCDKIDENGNKCGGYLVYDEREYKVCNKCGLGLIDQNVHNTDYYNIIDDIDNNGSFKGQRNRKDESIKFRIGLWNNFLIDMLINKSDKGAEELKGRYKRIREFEEMKKNEHE